VTHPGADSEVHRPVYLSSAHLIEVAGRIARLLPDANSDRLEQWLCVRYFETVDATKSEAPSNTKTLDLPQQVVLKIASCDQFAEAFFAFDRGLDETHPYFIVFKAMNSKRRWPKSIKGGNGWPAQSFWQRFAELDSRKPANRLFQYTKGLREITIATNRGASGAAAFSETILTSQKYGTRVLNVLDLAEWLLRRDAWQRIPEDSDVVGKFLQAIWIEDAEHVLFDAESQDLLTKAKTREIH
jgi:hypothetical protein